MKTKLFSLFFILTSFLNASWDSPEAYLADENCPIKTLVVGCGQSCPLGNDHSSAYTVDPIDAWASDYIGTLEGFLEKYAEALAGQWDCILIERADPYPEWTSMESIFADNGIYKQLNSLLREGGILVVQPNNAMMGMGFNTSSSAMNALSYNSTAAYVSWVFENFPTATGSESFIVLPTTSPEYAPSFLKELLGLNGFSFLGKELTTDMNEALKNVLEKNVAFDEDTYLFSKAEAALVSDLHEESLRSLLGQNFFEIVLGHYKWNFNQAYFGPIMEGNEQVDTIEKQASQILGRTPDHTARREIMDRSALRVKEVRATFAKKAAEVSTDTWNSLKTKRAFIAELNERAGLGLDPSLFE